MITKFSMVLMLVLIFQIKPTLCYAESYTLIKNKSNIFEELQTLQIITDKYKNLVEKNISDIDRKCIMTNYESNTCKEVGEFSNVISKLELIFSGVKTYIVFYALLINESNEKNNEGVSSAELMSTIINNDLNKIDLLQSDIKWSSIGYNNKEKYKNLYDFIQMNEDVKENILRLKLLIIKRHEILTNTYLNKRQATN